jgi:hypothetical protein
MACQGAGRWDVGQVRLLDGNPEARRDETVHQMVVLRGELEISGPAKGDRQRVALLLNLLLNLFPNLFPKPTQDFQMVQQRQDVVQRERQAGRVRQAEVELLDAAQMAQLQVLPGPQEQRLQEPPRVWQQQVLERVSAHLLLKMRALGRKAFQRDASPGFPELH